MTDIKIAEPEVNFTFNIWNYENYASFKKHIAAPKKFLTFSGYVKTYH